MEQLINQAYESGKKIIVKVAGYTLTGKVLSRTDGKFPGVFKFEDFPSPIYIAVNHVIYVSYAS